MIRFLFIIILFLSSCSSGKTKNDLFFSDKMSFEEFKLKLDEYGKRSPFQDIDD